MALLIAAEPKDPPMTTRTLWPAAAPMALLASSEPVDPLAMRSDRTGFPVTRHLLLLRVTGHSPDYRPYGSQGRRRLTGAKQRLGLQRLDFGHHQAYLP